jgi:hypothetical protein
MHTVPAAFLHASGLPSFFIPREQTTASAFTRAISETRTQADISLVTAEGDKVTLSANSMLQTAYASYDARGRIAGQQLDVHADAWQLATSHHTAVGVNGDLNDAERADIDHFLETLETMVTDFLAGEDAEAVMRLLDLGELGTLAGFEASFEYVEHVRIEQQYTAQGSLHHTPARAEEPSSPSRMHPKSLEGLLDSMVRAAQESRLAPEMLLEALPKFTDRFMHTLAEQHGAEALQTALAGHLLGRFAHRLEVLAAEQAYEA